MLQCFFCLLIVVTFFTHITDAKQNLLYSGNVIIGTMFSEAKNYIKNQPRFKQSRLIDCVLSCKRNSANNSPHHCSSIFYDQSAANNECFHLAQRGWILKGWMNQSKTSNHQPITNFEQVSLLSYENDEIEESIKRIESAFYICLLYTSPSPRD